MWVARPSRLSAPADKVLTCASPARRENNWHGKSPWLWRIHQQRTLHRGHHGKLGKRVPRMAAYAVLTALLFQKGSAESRRLTQQQTEQRSKCSSASAPRALLRGGWLLKV